ncbi:MAG TPA: thiamine pyrophosphate-dependent enzyme, partial [Rhodocyclaceae bacterium]|nr:thiamine pyrophosphate-dependent enzyme [Rhodocyclaceae bacterium]
MPRGRIKPGIDIESLSILDADATLDEALDPGLDDALLRALHRAMLRGRRFDERMLKLQRQGRIGTFAPIKGQEAAQIGAVAALEDEDWLVPAFRESGA